MTINIAANPDGSQGVTGTASNKEISQFHRAGQGPGCSSKTDSQRTIKAGPQNFKGGAVITPLGGSPLKYRATVRIGGMVVWTTEETIQSQFSGYNGSDENKHKGPEQSNGPFNPSSLQVDGTVDPQHPDVININEISDDGWGHHVTITGQLRLK